MHLPEDVLVEGYEPPAIYMLQQPVTNAILGHEPTSPPIRTSASSATSRRTVVDMAGGKMPRYMQQLLAWLAAFATAEPYISVPSAVPSDASAIVDPNFAGFAFEQASLWNYALDADGNANQFSINLIAAITNRTGGIPLIRLGGTS